MEESCAVLTRCQRMLRRARRDPHEQLNDWGAKPEPRHTTHQGKRRYTTQRRGHKKAARHKALRLRVYRACGKQGEKSAHRGHRDSRRPGAPKRSGTASAAGGSAAITTDTFAPTSAGRAPPQAQQHICRKTPRPKTPRPKRSRPPGRLDAGCRAPRHRPEASSAPRNAAPLSATERAAPVPSPQHGGTQISSGGAVRPDRASPRPRRCCALRRIHFTA